MATNNNLIPQTQPKDVCQALCCSFKSVHPADQASSSALQAYASRHKETHDEPQPPNPSVLQASSWPADNYFHSF